MVDKKAVEKLVEEQAVRALTTKGIPKLVSLFMSLFRRKRKPVEEIKS